MKTHLYVILPSSTQAIDLNDKETEYGLPYEIRNQYQGTISRVHRLRPDATAGALLTPDGIWLDVWTFGWTLCDELKENAISEKRWKSHFDEQLRQNWNCWVIETWAHS